MHALSFKLVDVAGQKVARSFKEDLVFLVELGETKALSQLSVGSMMT
jgi:hypothetical protein